MLSYLDAFRKHEQIEKGRGVDSVDTYIRHVKQFASWLKSENRPTAPAEVRRADVSAFLRALFMHLGALHNSTRAQKLASIRGFFRFLVFEGVIAEDPTRGIPSPKIEKKMPTKFTTEELKLIFGAQDDSTPAGIRDHAILITIYAAGLRVSELVGLNLGDIIDSGGYIRLRVRGKGSKERVLTLRTRASANLRRWLAVRAASETETGDIALTATPVFTSPLHGRLTDRSIANILKKYAGRVGIKEAEAFVHKLRATWATDLYDSGRDRCGHCGRPVQTIGLLEIAALAGWNDVKTAMRYIRISEKVLRKTALPDSRLRELEGGTGEGETE